MASILPQYESSTGVLLFVFSLLLTRTCAAVKDDMDDGTVPLIGLPHSDVRCHRARRSRSPFPRAGQFGHCSQELVNLLLCGEAHSNIFDGSVSMGDDGFTLKGIARRSGVGYLSLLEARRSSATATTAAAAVTTIAAGTVKLVRTLKLPSIRSGSLGLSPTSLSSSL
jgi:hypothetical protein